MCFKLLICNTTGIQLILVDMSISSIDKDSYASSGGMCYVLTSYFLLELMCYKCCGHTGRSPLGTHGYYYIH